MEDLYHQVDFIVSGGALKLLTDFLGSKNLPAVIVEQPDGGSFQILDAVGVSPDSLTFQGDDLPVAQLFSKHPPLSDFEVESAKGNEKWPCVVRIRGAHWELFILLGKEPDAALVSELEPYAGMIRLWRTFRRIDAAEKSLSRLSYMILATKSTLASIFEPMPLQYFATFLTDVLHESLFPRSVAVLQDKDGCLTLLGGSADSIPERQGVFAETILPPSPIFTKKDAAPFQVVLPVVSGECRLFCLMTWDDFPDEQMMNFMELLGSLAVRAAAINELRAQNQRAAAGTPVGEFTILSLSNAIKLLKRARDRSHFCSMLTDIFMEQGRMEDCCLALWDWQRCGYAPALLLLDRTETETEDSLLPLPAPATAWRVSETSVDLQKVRFSTALKSWGLDECSWKNMKTMRYLFPICDDAALTGFIALGSKSGTMLDENQLGALHLLAQFAAYELRKF